MAVNLHAATPRRSISTSTPRRSIPMPPTVARRRPGLPPVNPHPAQPHPRPSTLPIRPGETLPRDPAPHGVQPRRSPRLPHLEASRVGFEVSGVICSGTNLQCLQVLVLPQRDPLHQRAGRGGFLAHHSVPFNPELVYCCATTTLQATTVRAAAGSSAHCCRRAAQVKCRPANCLGSRVHPQRAQIAGGKMASASGKVKDGGVIEYQLKVVEYELMRSRNLEENERRMTVVRDKSTVVQQDMEANRTPKKKRKAPSHAPVSMNEGYVLRSSVTKEHDHVDPPHQPSKTISGRRASMPHPWRLLEVDCRYSCPEMLLFRLGRKHKDWTHNEP